MQFEDEAAKAVALSLNGSDWNGVILSVIPSRYSLVAPPISGQDEEQALIVDEPVTIKAGLASDSIKGSEMVDNQSARYPFVNLQNNIRSVKFYYYKFIFVL